MVESYDLKLIKSGKHLETYHYLDKPMLRGFTRRKKNPYEYRYKRGEWNELVKMWGAPEEVEALNLDKAQKTNFSISRTRTSIRRVVNSNPQLDKFLTLTFAQPTTDLGVANREFFDPAIKRIIRSRPEFQYISVVEFQKDYDFYGKKKELGGSVHYHLLCNMEMQKNMAIPDQFAWERFFAKKFWKNGFVKIKPVDEVENMGTYFCKYLGKDMFDERMFGKKKYFSSQDLNKPMELVGDKAKEFLSSCSDALIPKFQKTFIGEYTGTVDYNVYTISC